jgi:hypothetical protein
MAQDVQQDPYAAIAKPLAQAQAPAATAAAPAPAPAPAPDDPYASIARPMVTNTAGETMPADVAARHALTREGKTLTPQADSRFTAIGDIGEGFEKSAAQTAAGVGRTYKAAGGYVPHYLSNESGTGLFDAGDNTETHGMAQGVGGFAESIFEFMAGDEALKGLSFVEKLGYAQKLAAFAKSSPRWAKALSIGMRGLKVGENVARISAVADAQASMKAEGSGSAEGQIAPHSTEAPVPTMGEAADAGIHAAKWAGGTAGIAEVAAPFAETAVGKLFNKLNLPGKISATEGKIAAQQGEIDEVSKLGKAAAEKGQSIPFHDEFGAPGDAEKAIAAADTGAPSPLQQGLRGQALVKGVQGDLDAVHAKLGADYAAKLDEFSQQATEKGIQVGGADSPIAQKAQELLDKGSSLPGGIQDALKGSVPLMEKVQPILEELAKGEPMTWAQATELQKTLGNKAYSITDFSDPTKRVFSDLKSAVGQSLEKAATDGGAPEIAKGLSDMRADYGETIGKLQDNSVIAALRRKDLDGVAKLMMSRDTVGDNVQTLRGLLARVGSKNMSGVEGEMYEQLLNKSSDFTSGTRNLDFDKFTANFFKIPEEVRAQIWGNKIDEVAKDLKFAAEVRTGAAGAGEDGLATMKSKLDGMKADLAKMDTPMAVGLSLLIRHGGTSASLLKAGWDFLNGDTDKIQKDLETALVLEGGSFILKNPYVQKAVLGLLSYTAEGGTRNPIGALGSMEGDAAEAGPSLENVQAANRPAGFNAGLGGMDGPDRPRGNL